MVPPALQMPYRSLRRTDALAVVREHLTHHLLCIRGHWFVLAAPLGQRDSTTLG